MIINILFIVYIMFDFFGLCAQELPAYLYVNKRTELIYQRFYFIKRLRLAIEILQESPIWDMHFDQLDPLIFQNGLIQGAVIEMKKTGLINPISNLWDAFESYQHLYDSVFVQEYISLICIIYMMQKSYYISYKSVSIEYLLSYLDYCLDGYNGYNSSFDYDRRERLIEGQMVTDYVAKRYFIIKRLHKVVYFFNNCCCDELFVRSFAISRQFINQDIEHFQHARIREILKLISDNYSFEPLLEGWRECLQYRYLSDDQFINELIRGFLLFYKIFLLEYSFKKVDRQIISLMNYVLALYESINTLPLDEMLDMLDIITEELIAIQLRQDTEGQRGRFIYY